MSTNDPLEENAFLDKSISAADSARYTAYKRRARWIQVPKRLTDVLRTIADGPDTEEEDLPPSR